MFYIGSGQTRAGRVGSGWPELTMAAVSVLAAAGQRGRQYRLLTPSGPPRQAGYLIR